MKKNILNLEKYELEQYVLKKYQGKEIFKWLYKKREYDFLEYTNLSKELRNSLMDILEVKLLEIIKVEESHDVYKFLFKLKDSEYIETVLMKHGYGNSICVSTQVGCNMGCLFCESGKLKKVRDLEVYELISQILMVRDHLNIDINSVVLMGIGEPFDNYDNVVKFLKIINDSDGLDIGARKITVSTSGLVPMIDKFSDLGIQVNLAVSLHASNNKTRSELMPINKVYNLNMLMDSIRRYIDKTSRRVTIEYVMIKLVNDTLKDASNLVNLLKDLNVYVNLIPYNETSSNLEGSSDESIRKFYDILKKGGIDVTIRKKMGSKISAACGQLRSKEV